MPKETIAVTETYNKAHPYFGCKAEELSYKLFSANKKDNNVNNSLHQ
jgi:hypothetical protein